MSEKQVAQKRTHLFLRLFALFMDYAIVAGLSAVLMFLIDSLFNSTLGSVGFDLNKAVISVPVIVLYFAYFSAEIFGARSLGKQLLGIEIRNLNGEQAEDKALLNRFVIKHIGIFVLFLAVSLNHSILQLIAVFIFLSYLISMLAALGNSKLTIHDHITSLAVFPHKEMKTDLSQVSVGKTDTELAQEISSIRKNGSGKRMKTPPASAFPCAVELKVYAHEDEEMQDKIFNCFAEFIPNVHPRQLRKSNRKYGIYEVYKVVMRFENNLQMEASYESLASIEGVVTTATVRSVKVGAGSKQSLSAQATLG